MKNHESDPQDHGASHQCDEGCISRFLREQVLPCGLVRLISEAPLSPPGLWVQLLAPYPPASSPWLCCEVWQGNLNQPQRQHVKEKGSCQPSAQPALVSTAPHPAPVHTTNSTLGISCCLKWKRTRIRRIRIQYSLQAVNHAEKPPCFLDY